VPCSSSSNSCSSCRCRSVNLPGLITLQNSTQWKLRMFSVVAYACGQLLGCSQGGSCLGVSPHVSLIPPAVHAYLTLPA
jgi:hypothetical protein